MGFQPSAAMISADSHVTEPERCYKAFIDPAFRDRAPRIIKSPAGGDVYHVEGVRGTIPLGIIAAAGQDPREMRLDRAQFEDLHPGGWDPRARLADQDRDGVIAEVLYPSVGLAICNHADALYKRACFQAYNRWLAEFVSVAPERLIGIGQVTATSVANAIADVEDVKAKGLRGIMLPCEPDTDFDYDAPAFDPLWRMCVDLELPISFHILTAGRGKASVGRMSSERGPKENQAHSVIRANQDVIGTFIWGRVFERIPDLRIVCVEADAGWAPHFMYRLDYHYHRRRFWSGLQDMHKTPGEYFKDNVYLTFQDDPVAVQTAGLMNINRLMWANDFPHSDSTWPNSQALVGDMSFDLCDGDKRLIFGANARHLYKIN